MFIILQKRLPKIKWYYKYAWLIVTDILPSDVKISNWIGFQQQVQNFGEPFFLVIHEGETLAEIKVRIQKKLQVSDEEFCKVQCLSTKLLQQMEHSSILFSIMIYILKAYVRLRGWL